MRQKAVITVSAKARYDNGDREEMLYTATGAAEHTPDGYRIEYAEPEQSGMAGTETTLLLSPRRVELSRRGAVQLRLLFAPGESCSSDYETPCGMFRITVTTASLRVRTHENGALVKLEYEMEAGGAVSHRRLSVRVSAEGGEAT